MSGHVCRIEVFGGEVFIGEGKTREEARDDAKQQIKDHMDGLEPRERRDFRQRMTIKGQKFYTADEYEKKRDHEMGLDDETPESEKSDARACRDTMKFWMNVGRW